MFLVCSCHFVAFPLPRLRRIGRLRSCPERRSPVLIDPGRDCPRQSLSHAGSMAYLDQQNSLSHPAYDPLHPANGGHHGLGSAACSAVVRTCLTSGSDEKIHFFGVQSHATGKNSLAGPRIGRAIGRRADRPVGFASGRGSGPARKPLLNSGFNPVHPASRRFDDDSVPPEQPRRDGRSGQYPCSGALIGSAILPGDHP